MPATNRTVVVVEDDAHMRTAMESVLDARGYRSFLYESAEDALASGALDDAHCAILDVALPGMSGIELCERMRISPAAAATPVILITAHDAGYLRDAARACGVHAYLVKPFSGHRLADLVDGMPARRRGPASHPKASNNAH